MTPQMPLMGLDPDQQVKEIYAHFGLALYEAQVLEHRFVIAMALADLFPNMQPSQTLADFDLFMDKHFAMTLGGMIKEFSKFVAVPPTLESMLVQARSKRNWLAHNFFRERAEEFMNMEGRHKMLAELQDAQRLFEQCDDALSEVTQSLHERFGPTDEELEKRLKETLDRVRSDL